jgi:hypothetical protein
MQMGSITHEGFFKGLCSQIDYFQTYVVVEVF